MDNSNNVYVGGNFTTADGVSCSRIAKWNGKTFIPLGSGVDNVVYCIKINNDGFLVVGGSFTSAGGVTLSDRVAIWNGYVWAHVDINLPGAPTVNYVLPINDDLYLGYTTVGDATSSYLNAITNNSSASSYPIIKIARTGGTTAVMEWFKNETTGDTLWCNYSLLDGEELTIDLTPGRKSIKSNFFGDVWRAVLRTSDLSSFNLLPDSNDVSVFVNPTGAPTITAWAEWPITHWSADNVAA
jgi:hypothetical protein